MNNILKKNIKLTTLLTGMVTGSIGITALTLPQFESLDSYLFKYANWQTTETFVSANAAYKYMQDNFDVDSFFEVREDESIAIKEWVIKAALEGVKNNYITTENVEGESVSGDNAESDYQSGSVDLKDEIYEVILNQLKRSTFEQKYLPVNVYGTTDAVLGTSTDAVSNIHNTFRGLNNESFSSAEAALRSLMDLKGSKYSYNNVDYFNLSDIYPIWMADNNFSESEMIQYNDLVRVNWELDYELSNGMIIPMSGTENWNGDMNDIREIVQNGIISEIPYGYERHLIEEHYLATEQDWEATSDFSSSYDAYRMNPANTVRSDSYLNGAFFDDSIGDVLGWGKTGFPRTIDGPADAFLPSGNMNFMNFYSTKDTPLNNGYPNLNQNLDTAKEIALLSLAALFTTTIDNDYYNNPDANSFFTSVTNMCAGGVSQRNSEEWKSWDQFATFMGFDNIQIPIEDRYDWTDATVNKWWELDCEGSFNLHNGSASLQNTLAFLNNTFFYYFDTQIDRTNYDALDKFFYSNQGGQDAIIDGAWFEPIGLPSFTFSSGSGDPVLTNKTMMEALMYQEMSSPTIEDYKNSDSAYSRDYYDWEQTQELIYIWNNTEYKGKIYSNIFTNIMEDVNSRVESFFPSIVYTDVNDTLYKFNDTQAAYLKSLYPNVQVDNLQEWGHADYIISDVFYSYGAGVIFTTPDDYYFFDDPYFNFDSSISYDDIDEMASAVDWYNRNDNNIWTASGYNGDFSDAIEYSQYASNLFENYNNSGIDIIFNLSIENMAREIIYRDGLNIQSVDSSIEIMKLNIIDFDQENPDNEINQVVKSYSLSMDDLNPNKTVWMTTEAYDPTISGAEVNAVIAAKEALLEYWKRELNL